MLNLTQQKDNQLEFRLTDQLTGEDYRQGIQPVRQALTEHPSLNVLVEVADFTGWDPVGLWQEARSDLKLRHQIAKVAFVGDPSFEAWGGRFANELTPVQVKFFTDIPAARDWLGS